MKYWRLIGHYDAETTAWSACAGAMQASPYTPDENATLIAIRTIVGRTAATTLTDGIQFRITSTSFVPNQIQAMALGSGLQTAPAFPAPPQDYPVMQKVVLGNGINVEGRCANASGVTNDVFVMGLFDNGRG